MSETNADMDRAGLERCDVFSDLSRREAEALFTVPADHWAALLAKWRRDHPFEAAITDQALALEPETSDFC